MPVFSKLLTAAAASLLLVGGAAVPAQADVSTSDDFATVSVTGEPTAMNVGDSTSFDVAITKGAAGVCDRNGGEITVLTSPEVAVNPTNVLVPRSACDAGTPFLFTLDAVSAGTAEVSVIYKGRTTLNVIFNVVVSAAPPSDVTPPVVTITAPVEGGSYFLGSVPPAAYTCTDDVAVQSCTQSGYSDALGTHTMQVTGVDTSGNTTIQSVTYSVVPVPDTTPPVVTITAPADGATYTEGSVPPPAYACTDDVEVASCVESGYSAAVGTHTMTVVGTDTSNNTASASVQYTVVPVGPVYSFTGFYSPVDMGGVVNTIKGGKTVPLKFELFANGVEVTDPAAITFSVAPSDVCMTGAPTDAVEFTTTGGTSLRYDAATGQFVQNWKTPSTKNGCYAVTASAGAAEITAYFMTKA